MEEFKKTAKRIGLALLYPHVLVICLLVPVSAAALILAFVLFGSEHPLSYVFYMLSLYTLTVVCFRIPDMIAFFKRLKSENKYILRYTTDTRLRMNTSLYGTLIFNTAYALFQLGLGFVHHTVWYYSFAVYYILLAVMRFFLLRYTRSHEGGEDRALELKKYRFCGIVLALMNLALSVVVFYIAYMGRTFHHHEITTIAMAAYTFTTFTFAIINIKRYRKYNSPAFSAAKAISLTSALVSMLTLESTMLTSFGEVGQEKFASLMTALTGGAVTATILTLAVYMIVKSTKELKRLAENGENDGTEKQQ